MECRAGTGRFQWNTGGWFGSQLGSTCWMLLCGLLFLIDSEILAGLLMLACFAVPNIVGTAVWARRGRIAPYPAVQLLLVVLFISTAAALVLTDCLGLLGRLDPRFEDPRILYLLLLLFPALMLVFHLRNGSSTQHEETDS